MTQYLLIVIGVALLVQPLGLLVRNISKFEESLTVIIIIWCWERCCLMALEMLYVRSLHSLLRVDHFGSGFYDCYSNIFALLTVRFHFE